MSTEIVLPKLGFSMNEGTVTEWLAAEGATVKKGQPLYSLESEKSVQEIESPADGVLRVKAPTGEILAVGTVLGVIE